MQVLNFPAATPKQALKSKSALDTALDADLFKALGDPSRLKLLACMAKCARLCSVSELAECCDIDLSVVSRHLSILAKAKIIRGKKEGRSMCYEVKFAELAQIFRTLADELGSCSCKCGENGCGK